jgi:NTE family protein
MGSILSCSKKDDSLVQSLREQINDMNQQLVRQAYIIDLLKCKQNSDYCIKNGITSFNDTDIFNCIEQTKCNREYENLIFSGGGIKGIAYCGALQALEKENILYDNQGKFKIKKLGGTSAGSIIASLLAVGYTPSELTDIMINFDSSVIVDDKWGILGDALNFLNDYGIAPGEKFYELMGQYINMKKGNEDYTIDQLYNDTGIYLSIVGTNMNTCSSIYFYPNNDKYKDIPIRQAVRISMGIPFLFEPYILDDDYCVVGGVLDNYPLHLFDGNQPGEMEARLNVIPPNHKTLGLCIMNNSEVDSYIIKERQNIKTLSQYAVSYISTFLTENQRRIMTPSYWLRTINIITPDYDLTKFDLTKQQKIDLCNDGINAVTEFFNDN